MPNTVIQNNMFIGNSVWVTNVFLEIYQYNILLFKFALLQFMGIKPDCVVIINC